MSLSYEEIVALVEDKLKNVGATLALSNQDPKDKIGTCDQVGSLSSKVLAALLAKAPKPFLYKPHMLPQAYQKSPAFAYTPL